MQKACARLSKNARLTSQAVSRLRVHGRARRWRGSNYLLLLCAIGFAAAANFSAPPAAATARFPAPASVTPRLQPATSWLSRTDSAYGELTGSGPTNGGSAGSNVAGSNVADSNVADSASADSASADSASADSASADSNSAGSESADSDAANATGPYQAHVIMAEDFARPWTPAEKNALWNAGLPAPDMVTTGADLFTLAGVGGSPHFAPVGGALEQAAQSTPRQPPATFAPAQSQWSPLYRQSFDAGFPNAANDGACRFMLLSADSTLWWNFDATYTDRNSPGAAAVIDYLPPTGETAPGSAPNERTAQIVCIFDHMTAARNLMVQFALRLERSPGSSFFAGFSTDGHTFLGRRWRDTVAQDAEQAQWTLNRLYLPFAGDHARSPTGAVAVLWEYRTSQPASALIPIALDAIAIDQFAGGPGACRAADPRLAVPGTPGATPVSKGVNLPAYPAATPSGLSGHVARLKASGVNWVRLEFESRMPPSVSQPTLNGAGGELSYFDFRHFDALLDLLCADPQPIAVLGLLDYKTMLNPAWRTRGQFDEAWLASFLAHTRLLVRYYHDRVAHWEIWNEPDFSATYLAPAAYARLLEGAAAAIKQEDPAARVLFGGLGGVDRNAERYLQQVLAQLPPGPGPFDIFAIHPYPSKQFTHNGVMIRDPSYLHYHTPTVLQPFLDALAAAGRANTPIWVTEIGWNRAADSSNPATLSCSPINQTMVTGPEQALYLPVQMDILFKETAWAPGIPSVTKIFWYQYGDVGLSIAESQCQGRDWPDDPQARVVDWWYGLFSGTDPAHGIPEPQPNLSACTFRAYPDPGAVNQCFSQHAAAAVTESLPP